MKIYVITNSNNSNGDLSTWQLEGLVFKSELGAQTYIEIHLTGDKSRMKVVELDLM